MTIKNEKTQIAVIGAGPGGYAAAFKCADLGMEVTLIDTEEKPGGVCLYKGCIPSKTLLHVSRVLSEIKELHDYGVHCQMPEINLDRLREKKDDVISSLTDGLSQLNKQRKIKFIRGRASFLESQKIRIIEKEIGETHLEVESSIIATGSRPIVPSDWPVDSENLWTSTEALELNEIPKKLCVIGGGYIGLELGSVYASLGSEVSLLEMEANLLPGVDRDLILPLRKRLDQNFHLISTETKVEIIEQAEAGLKVSYSTKEGQKKTEFDKVLVAIGRKTNVNGLGLENTKVKVEESGFIKVNNKRKTDDSAIYAIGDVASQPMLAHKATYEARIVAESLAGQTSIFDPKAIPAVVFTDPEIAWCGLTEKEAKEKDKKVQVLRFPWQASGRAMSLSRTEGLSKIIVDPESEAVLGVGLSGVGAGEMIAEAVLAIEMGATVSDLSLSIHPHPTLSETIMEAAELFHGPSTHLYRPKRQ